MTYGLAALFGAVVVMLGMTAGTASAQLDAVGQDLPEQLTVSVDSDCTLTVQAHDLTYHVTSGTRTAGLAIEVNGETEAYTPPDPEAENGGPYSFSESLSFGPVTNADVVKFRWFAGPDRGDGDLPAWDTTTYPDWVDTVVARETAEDRHWDARDDAEFVNWYTYEVTNCPPATESPEPTETPEATPTATESPEAGTLPETSGVRLLPVLLIGGIAVIGVGATILYVTRRRVDSAT